MQRTATHLRAHRKPVPTGALRSCAERARASDSALVQWAQQGQRAAFDVLVTRYQHRIFRLAQRYTRDRADAEDVSQDAFIKAYRSLCKFRSQCSFYTWIYRITTNSAKSLLQARARDPLADATGVAAAEGWERISQCLHDQQTPELLRRSDDICIAVHGAIATLPHAHRKAILLREIDGLSYKQIARTMGTPVGTVRSRVSRAREAIDRTLRSVADGGLARRSRCDGAHGAYNMRIF